MISSSDTLLLKKYQTVLAEADMGLWEWDFSTNSVHLDDGILKLYGLPPGSSPLTAAQLFELIHPEDRRLYFDKNEEVSAAGEFAPDSSIRIVTSTGQIKYLRNRSRQIRNTDGTVIGHMGLSWDVTSEVLLKEEKEKTDWQFQLMISLIESSTDLFGFSDKSGVPLYVNQVGHDVFGVQIGQKYFAEYVAKKDQKYIYEVVIPRLRANKGWEGEVLAFNPMTKEEIPIWLRIFSVKLGPTHSDIFYACSGSDLRKLKAIQNSLIMQSKMAALGEMAAEMAHEINNPLMIIQVKSQMLHERLTKGVVDAAKIISDLQLIEKNSHRIQKIVHSSKAISRNAELDPYSQVSILTLIDETFEIFQERFNKRKLKLELIVGDGINYNDMIEARGSEILQVFVNLLNNAYDAIRHQPEGWVQFELSKAVGNFYEIQVVDSGVKIPKGIADKMMEPFFTTKPTGQGTGLGLSISKQIIENHRGQLFYDSNAPHTRFVVTLQKKINA
ncbi:MAG: PAS domain-containing protein [Bdellovibrio sp.]|nr:PAS domain-containing protein [Bdellovibrio sp.]